MDELTKKEKGFVKDYIKTGNGTQSIINNYDTDNRNTASVMASENLARPRIINAIKSIADSLPEEDLIKVHKEGLQATKKIFKNNNESGEIEEVAEEPDYAIRHKYLDSAYKIKGTYAPEKSINLDIQANIADPKARELAQKYEEELKKGL